MTKKNLLHISLIFIIWRTALFAIAFAAPKFLAYQPSFPYTDTLLASNNLPAWLYSFANFDGVHYLTIAQKGYFGTGLIQAFFPLFPLLITVLSKLGIKTIIAGLIISNLASFLFLVIWFSILKKMRSEKFAYFSLAIILSFPTSFFLVSFYNESLFLCLILAVFYLSKKQKWILAGLLAGLASATRVVGIFSILIILIEAWQHYGKKLWMQPAKYRNVYLAGILASTGLLTYMYYLNIKFNDPLYFLHLQEKFGAGRQASIIFYPQVIWRYLKILATARPINLKYYSYVQDFVVGVAGFLILIWQLWKTSKIYLSQKVKSWTKIEQKIAPLSLIIFSLASFILPTLTGTFSSMPRYVLVCVSIWWFVAKILQTGAEQKKLGWQIAYFFISISLLVVNAMLFVQGCWVG